MLNVYGRKENYEKDISLLFPLGNVKKLKKTISDIGHVKCKIIRMWKWHKGKLQPKESLPLQEFFLIQKKAKEVWLKISFQKFPTQLSDTELVRCTVLKKVDPSSIQLSFKPNESKKNRTFVICWNYVATIYMTSQFVEKRHLPIACCGRHVFTWGARQISYKYGVVNIFIGTAWIYYVSIFLSVCFETIVISISCLWQMDFIIHAPHSIRWIFFDLIALNNHWKIRHVCNYSNDYYWPEKKTTNLWPLF